MITKAAKQFLRFLGQPYPFYANSKQAWMLVLCISIFITFFCIMFRPFGLDTLPESTKYFISASYGVVTLLVTTLNMVFLPQIFKGILNERQWTVYKELIWVFWILTCIATANYFYSGLFFTLEPSWPLFFTVLWFTIIVGLMPAIGVIFFKQLYMYKKFISEAAAITAQLGSRGQFDGDAEGRITITSENNKERVELALHQLLYVASTGNYVEVFYLEGERVAKSLLRNRISKVYEALCDIEGLFRCHRTHIVNLSKVRSVDGNSQGYKLHLTGTDEVVPVARSYSRQIRQMLSGSM